MTRSRHLIPRLFRIRNFLSDKHRSRCKYQRVGEKHIRLLRVQPGQPGEVLHVQLFTVQLDTQPVYDALSYVWGDPNVTSKVICDGRPFTVTVNLRDALNRLRSPTEVRILWADAICINQDDPIEKMAQVKMMGLIYWSARRVHVWLGNKDETVYYDTDHALLLLDDLSALHQRNKSRNGESLYRLKAEDLFEGPQERWQALSHFFNLTWFKRVWVVQEVGLANDAIFYWGESVIPRAKLDAFADFCFFSGQLLLQYLSVNLSQYDIMWSYSHETRGASDTRDEVNVLECANFLDLMDKARNLDCTKEVDRIYAFLGHPVATKGHITKAGVSTSYAELAARETIVEPNYEKSHMQLYHDLSLTWIRENPGNYTMFNYIVHNEVSAEEDFPSWIPRWNLFPAPRKLTVSSKQIYKASEKLGPSDIKVINDTQLQIRALRIDSVHYTWAFPGKESFTILNIISPLPLVPRTPQPDERLNPVEHLWMDFEPKVKSLQNSKSADLLQFCNTITAGVTGSYSGDIKNVEKCQEEHFANFQRYRIEKAAIWGPELAEEKQKELEMFAGDADRYFSDVQRASADRSFFCTKNGVIGLGPLSMRVSDQCWLPLGSDVPFILRQVEGNRFRILGQAYMNGIMQGELAGRLHEEDFQSIILC